MLKVTDMRLQFKLAWPILLVVALILGSYFFYTLNEKRRLSYANLKYVTETSAKRLSKSLSNLLWNENIEVAKTILESEAKKDAFNSIVILDEDKKEVVLGYKKIAKNGKTKIDFKQDISSLLNNDLKKNEGPIFYIEDDDQCGSTDSEVCKDDDSLVDVRKKIVGWYSIYIDDSKIQIELENAKRRMGVILVSLIFSITLMIVFLINIFVTRPFEEIIEVSNLIRTGNFSKRVSKKFSVGEKNEIALLSNSINNMADEIQKLTTGLQNEVNAQTKEIQIQNQSFLNLLSNLDQGFLIINYQGSVENDPTNKTVEIFNDNPKGKNITDVFNFNTTEKKAFHKWLTHVFKGVMPFKDLLPLAHKRINDINGRILELEYKPIFAGKGWGKIEKVICIINDITKEVNFTKKVEFAREKSDMILKLVDHPLEFLDVISELQALIEDYQKNPKNQNYENLFRAFHTIKARVANFKISEVVKRIHGIEEDLFEIMEKEKRKISDLASEKGVSENLIKTRSFVEENEKIIKNMSFKVHNLNIFLHDYLKENRNIVELAQSCLNSGEKFEELHKAREELLNINNNIMKNFVNKNLRDLFFQYSKTLKEVGSLQEKEISFEVEETDITVKPESYKDFFESLHHVFRNIVDHGIEEKSERIDQNKKEEAVVKVFFKKKGRFHFQIGIRDDGKGIDPLQIREKAKKVATLNSLPLNKMSGHELIQLIFEPGFSTRESATTISGRGIGMDAVRKTILDLEGRVWVESDVGEGTLFVAELPFAA